MMAAMATAMARTATVRAALLDPGRRFLYAWHHQHRGFRAGFAELEGGTNDLRSFGAGASPVAACCEEPFGGVEDSDACERP